MGEFLTGPTASTDQRRNFLIKLAEVMSVRLAKDKARNWFTGLGLGLG